MEFWQNRIKILEVSKMEDKDFISEILFILLVEKIKEKFINLTDFIESLNLDYSQLKSLE